MKELSEELLQEMTQALVDELDPEAIYLFGSHAWGEPHEDSDVDFMVVVDEEDPRRRFELATLARRALRKFNVPNDIILRSRKHFQRFSRAVSALEYDVVTDGRRLYARQ